jgi:hypothetical protein
MLLTEVYERHEIPLHLTDDDLTRMTCLEFGSSSKTPISVTIFTPNTLQTDPVVSLGQAVNAASKFYTRLTQLTEWDGLLHMYLMMTSYIVPGIFGVADIVQLIDNQLDTIPLHIMDPIPPVGSDSHVHVGRILLGALSFDEATLTDYVNRQVRSLVSQRDNGTAVVTSDSVNNIPSVDGSPTGGDGTAHSTVDYSSDDPDSLPPLVGPMPCHWWILGKGPCGRSEVCSGVGKRKKKFPHSFNEAANSESAIDAYKAAVINRGW